jgi:ssDNA-binding Zn-finger/Zn-ribbon topoisomerase 1
MVRELEYSENHHIIPRSLGGKDTPDNLVSLTPREHFIAHFLLYKSNPCVETAGALHFMNIVSGKHMDNRYVPASSKLYETAKTSKYKFMRGKKLPQVSCVHCRKTIAVNALSRNHGDRCAHHPDPVLALSNQKHRERPAQRGKRVRPRIDVTCPWCNKTGDKGAMNMWHFDNCLKNPNIDHDQQSAIRAARLQPSLQSIKLSNAGPQGIVTCPHCGKIGGKSAMGTWHIDNCLKNPSGTKNRPVKSQLSEEHKLSIRAGLKSSSKKIGAPRKSLI